METLDTHPWVADYTAFEAVLVCNNELPAWEKDTTIRAFQTFLFNVMSADDDEPTFVHNETGTIIRHQGDVLAIEYGERWTDSLSDLVLALHALGWLSAEAYHPAESMKLFLDDIGRAIPARVNFDVRPAQVGKRLADYPEVQSLRLRARELLGGGDNSSEQAAIIMREFGDLGAPLVTLGEPPAARATRPIQLLDDDESEPSSEFVVFGAAAARGKEVDTLGLEFEPSVFLVPEEVGAAEMLPVSAIAPAPAAELQDVAGGHEPSSEPTVPAPAEQVSAGPSSFAAKVAAPRGADNCVLVGQSLVLFDTPAQRLSEAELEYWLTERGLPRDRVVHVEPGRINGPVRWDLLGEMSDDQPWFTEKLVGCMRLGRGVNAALIGALLVAAKKHAVESADLRDVLHLICQSEAEIGAALSSVSATAGALFAHANSSGSLKGSISALVQRLGPLALTSPGSSFVDIALHRDGSPGPQNFTIRELVRAEPGYAYVVRVSELDSSFVGWITLCLRDASRCIASPALRNGVPS